MAPLKSEPYHSSSVTLCLGSQPELSVVLRLLDRIVTSLGEGIKRAMFKHLKSNTRADICNTNPAGTHACNEFTVLLGGNRAGDSGWFNLQKNRWQVMNIISSIAIIVATLCAAIGQRGLIHQHAQLGPYNSFTNITGTSTAHPSCLWMM